MGKREGGGRVGCADDVGDDNDDAGSCMDRMTLLMRNGFLMMAVDDETGQGVGGRRVCWLC